MPYCPKCSFEYKEGVGKCPDCGASLVDELEEEEPTQAMEYVPLRTLPSRLYAQMV
ncbi:MAG: zinc ribbon domain-containing protein, partial [candidate division Zixibacteria bacterium]|nr:zinc ribbon domain-containing protein [candidate division Zixibacteria bacterium]